MKTMAELKQENDLLRGLVRDQKLTIEALKLSVNDCREALRIYKQLSGIPALRVVR